MVSLVNTNSSYSVNKADVSCMLTQRILLATGELGNSTRYWCGVGFLPYNYVPVKHGSSSKQLGHADMLKQVKSFQQNIVM